MKKEDERRRIQFSKINNEDFTIERFRKLRKISPYLKIDEKFEFHFSLNDVPYSVMLSYDSRSNRKGKKRKRNSDSADTTSQTDPSATAQVSSPMMDTSTNNGSCYNTNVLDPQVKQLQNDVLNFSPPNFSVSCQRAENISKLTWVYRPIKTRKSSNYRMI